jgi:hypothetical protein
MQMGSHIEWDLVTKKKARGNDEYDLGQVQEVTSEYVITRNEFEKKIFQLPKRMARSFNGDTIVFDLSGSEANSFRLLNEDSVRKSNETQLERTLDSKKSQRKIPAKETRLKVKETTQREIELAHEELVIEQKRLPKPEEINEQEIDEQNSDSVVIKIPLKGQKIKLD